ncbi:hypothetical protein [Terriglobus aquaticus]|uniref:Uncharacterized protein n=1 Tax=Terriglobus aquaticus TaxID=940139 RepID=A0ABW9KH52_9BACT|nr:hypothetical protein [Terriglobus aquaticus]
MKPLTLRDVWSSTRKAERDLPLELLVGSKSVPMLAVVRRSAQPRAENASALIFAGASAEAEA